MASVTERIDSLARRVSERLMVQELVASGDGLAASELLARVDDSTLEALLKDVSSLRSELDALLAAGAGVIAKRSEFALGYAGLAQSRGHRSPVAMVQQLTGTTRAEASRHVRLGELMGEADAATRLASSHSEDGVGSDLLDATDGSGGRAGDVPGPDSVSAGAGEGAGGHVSDGVSPEEASCALPWFEPLTRAVREHRLKPEAVTLVTRILGEAADRVPAETLRAAATEMIETAGDAHADELARRARFLRDEMDPVGVEIRAAERYRARSLRFSRNPRTGARTAYLEFDDESAAWFDSIVGAALRPRRGGPRFVDPAERTRARQLVEDRRTNEQILFDLLMDIVRTGVDVDPSLAYGTRQPGVRVVITRDQLERRDQDGNPSGYGYLEETGEAVSGATVDRMICSTGIVPISVDENGSPLDVGREHRLFQPKQRLALSIRDGGCRYPGCDRPPSYTEAHHIDHWSAHGGRTDLADGILLCRHHHMLVHNNHWQITRDGTVFHLVPPRSVDPEQTPLAMPTRSPLNPPWRRAAPVRPSADGRAPYAHPPRPQRSTMARGVLTR